MSSPHVSPAAHHSPLGSVLGLRSHVAAFRGVWAPWASGLYTVALWCYAQVPGGCIRPGEQQQDLHSAGSGAAAATGKGIASGNRQVGF